jgi:diguanylate cyclase
MIGNCCNPITFIFGQRSNKSYTVRPVQEIKPVFSFLSGCVGNRSDHGFIACRPLILNRRAYIRMVDDMSNDGIHERSVPETDKKVVSSEKATKVSCRGKQDNEWSVLGGSKPSAPPNGHVLRDLVDESHKIARRVLPFLGERRIPITPTNYRLWYDYFSDGCPELKATLDQLIKEGKDFTPDLTQALYQRFFSVEATETQSRFLEMAGEKIQAMAVDVVKNLILSIAQTSKFSRFLSNHLEDIDKARNINDVRGVVSSIIAETEAMITNQDRFHETIEQTNHDLAELQEELRRRDQLANTDELTKLYNRRAFNVRLAEETGRSARYGVNLALIMLDLDNFKIINDTYGHLVGDRLLVLIAQAIKLTIRGSDCAARYGGEEFAVICPETNRIGASRVAERLREAVDFTTFTVRGRTIKVTISLGVATLKDDEGSDELLDRADRALYLAKKRGKNRVCHEMELEDAIGAP